MMAIFVNKLIFFLVVRAVNWDKLEIKLADVLSC